MKEIQWRDSTPESVRQTGTPSAAKENLRLHGVEYTPMTANKHTTLFDGGVVKQVTTPLQVVADDDTQEVQLLNLYPDIRYQTIDGFAFHWYSGDHFDAVRLVREQYPDKRLIFTEGCIEYSFRDKDQLKNAQIYAHDMIGNFNAGMNLFFDWNIVLDEKGGPNHVSNLCDAPIMCNPNTKEVEYKLSYYYIAQFSHYVLPGAKRIAATCYTDKLETVSFVNPDGTLAVVLLNRTEQCMPVTLRIKGSLIACEIEASSMTTIVCAAKGTAIG